MPPLPSTNPEESREPFHSIITAPCRIALYYVLLYGVGIALYCGRVLAWPFRRLTQPAATTRAPLRRRRLGTTRSVRASRAVRRALSR